MDKKVGEVYKETYCLVKVNASNFSILYKP